MSDFTRNLIIHNFTEKFRLWLETNYPGGTLEQVFLNDGARLQVMVKFPDPSAPSEAQVSHSDLVKRLKGGIWLTPPGNASLDAQQQASEGKDDS